MLRGRFLILGLVVVIVVGAGVAYAQTTGDETINACVHAQTGALRIADTCRPGETPLSWSRGGGTQDVGPINLAPGEERVLAQAGSLRVIGRCVLTHEESGEWSGDVVVRSEDGVGALGAFEPGGRVELNMIDAGPEQAFRFGPQSVTERHPSFTRFEVTLLSLQGASLNGDGYLSLGGLGACTFGGWFATG